MKFSYKLALTLSILSLCLSLSAVSAQTPELYSVVSPTTQNLNAVCIVQNATENNDLMMLNAWAVGDGGTILMWDGMLWNTVESPTTSNLYSVMFVNPTDGWAVGGDGDTGVILHYNGTWSIWDKVSFNGEPDRTDPISATLYSVTVDTDGMTGWAVGSNGVALYWDASSDIWFGFTDVSTETLRSVAMLHGTVDAWAVGDGGTILHWDGAEWTTMSSPTTAPLYAIQVFNSSSAVAAGGSGDEGVVLMLNDDTWEPWTVFKFGGSGETITSINSTIYSISIASSTSAWACGSNGLTMFWVGTDWSCNSNVATGDLKGIAMLHESSTDSVQAWAVGENGQIVAFNGTSWVPELPIFVVPLILAIGLVAAVFAKSKLFKKPLFLY